jgi:hypothetical protein
MGYLGETRRKRDKKSDENVKEKEETEKKVIERKEENRK